MEWKNLKKAQEMRVNEFSVQKLRENHATRQELTSQIQELQERVNCMNDSREFQDRDSFWSGKLSHVPSQSAVVPSPQSMLSRDQSLQPDGHPCAMCDSSHIPYSGILHTANQSATGGITMRDSTGRPVDG